MSARHNKRWNNLGPLKGLHRVMLSHLNGLKKKKRESFHGDGKNSPEMK